MADDDINKVHGSPVPGAERPPVSFVDSPTEWARERCMSPLAMFVTSLLAAQFAAHTLSVRFSRAVLQETYAPSAVVMLSEALKALVCACVIAATGPASEAAGRVFTAARGAPPRLLVVVVGYFVQNMLAIVAIRNLTPATFALLIQLKTAWTVLWSIILIGRKYSIGHWRAIALLVMATLLLDPTTSSKAPAAAPAVAVLNTTSAAVSTHAARAVEAATTHAGSVVVGVASVVAMGALSGFSSVYLEVILKDSPRVSIWERNLQLALCSLGPAALTCSFNGALPQALAIATLHSWATLLVISLSALGGILVAAVMKYADNVVKCFATGAGLCITAAAGSVLFNDRLGFVSMVGIAVGVVSVFNFAAEAPPIQPPVDQEAAAAAAAANRQKQGTEWKKTWAIVGTLFAVVLVKQITLGNRAVS
eukprot:m51a1_g7045 putative udp-n-acetylglucosamine (423) ;mRNA; f:125960-127484